jgi:antirestriction protein ArdC
MEEPTSESETMNVEQARKLADSAIEQLATALEQGQSETLRVYLAAMGRFHRYSLNNVILIALARPGATQVAGFHTWKRLGRHVRKGEKGIAILAPLVRKGTERRRNRLLVREGGVSGRAESDSEEVLGFRTAYVFDVSQTEGKPLPEFARASGDPGDCTERLKAFISRQGIKLDYSERIAPAQGRSSEGRITLLPGLPPAEEFSVLAHELAHCVLHGKAEQGQSSKAVRETEAEAVAYAVCQTIGLDASLASSDYVQLWDGDTKTLAASLARIRGVAVEIIRAVDTYPNDTKAHSTLLC